MGVVILCDNEMDFSFLNIEKKVGDNYGVIWKRYDYWRFQTI